MAMLNNQRVFQIFAFVTHWMTPYSRPDSADKTLPLDRLYGLPELGGSVEHGEVVVLLKNWESPWESRPNLLPLCLVCVFCSRHHR